MMSKNTALALAVASALGASSAYALGPTAVPDVELVQMGSSAVFKPIEQVWVGDYCVAGTIGEYRDATANTQAAFLAGGSNYRAYFCTLQNKAPVTGTGLAGKAMLYEEREAGGSVFGVNPVATSTAESYMSALNSVNSTLTGGANCVDVGPNPGPPATSFAAGTYEAYTCTGALASKAPDLGISDVEPQMFVPPNLPSTFPQPLTGAQLNNLTISPMLQQTFAIGVGSGVSGQVTNVTTAQVTSILTGVVTDWHTINQAIAPGTAITACVRTAGSGTQAAANALFLAAPCSSTGQLGLAAASSTFILNGSTGTLLSCLDTHPNSIGIFSLADGPAATDTFKVVSLDSVAASAQNAATGAYAYNVESTLQYRNTGGYTPNQTALLGVLNTILSTPADLAVVNAGLPNAALNAEPANGFTPTAPYSAATPVEWGSRFGNTCQPNQLGFP